MKNLAYTAVLVLSTAGLAFGQATVAPSPGATTPYETPAQTTPYPANASNQAPYGTNAVQPAPTQAPSGQPGQPETAMIGAPTQVLVLPFTPVGDDAVNHYAWVSQAIDEGVKANLARDPAVQFQGGASTAYDVKNSNAVRDAALAGARKINASVVILGTYQVAGDQLRVSGEALSVADGKSLAGIDATGSVRDLFQIEDSVNSQIAQVLPGPANQPLSTNNTQVYTPPPAPDQNTYQAPIYSNSPNVTYYYPDYSPTVPYDYSDYDYGYSPYYYSGYPYGLYGGGLFFYGGYGYGGYRSGWYGRGWYGRGWGGGGYHGPVHAFGGGGFHGAAVGGGFHGGGGFGGGFHGGGGFGGGHR